ncbi:hypothetical protein AX17_006595 [Amanita inopinata Kibby_2008]|nr:hypothetical protein AX17_006595 [Amanita inopinata Kibby_2008]
MHVLKNAEWLRENNSLSAPLDSGPTALAACTGGRSSLICSNCKKPGHTVDYCISPSGGMARKTIEESKLAHREAQKRKTSSGPQHKVAPTSHTQMDPTLPWTRNHSHPPPLPLSVLLIDPIKSMQWNMMGGLLLRRRNLEHQ